MNQLRWHLHFNKTQEWCLQTTTVKSEWFKINISIVFSFTKALPNTVYISQLTGLTEA